MGLILYGAGSVGGYALKHLRSKGIEPSGFADSDPKKWNTEKDGVAIWGPEICRQVLPDAEWVATAISRPAAVEIRAAIKFLGVKSKPLWECLDVHRGVPSIATINSVQNLFGSAERGSYDEEGLSELWDQICFRKHPDLDRQRDPSPISELYFPPFIKHRDDEHYVDCGAADGDTIKVFASKWENHKYITAFEPDQVNHDEMLDRFPPPDFGRSLEWMAVGDTNGNVELAAHGDYSSHLNPEAGERSAITVFCTKLDDYEFICPPTYIKMDIEGSELEALWGARRILKEHSPVLAICAYHTSDHLWQIPLLIHAIQPDYKLFLRRYAEGAFELVWYAVPRERVI